MHPTDVLVGSHTHQPMERRWGRTLVVNSGAVGSPFNGDGRAQYLWLTLGRGGVAEAEFRRVAYDSEIARGVRDQRVPRGGGVARAALPRRGARRALVPGPVPDVGGVGGRGARRGGLRAVPPRAPGALRPGRRWPDDHRIGGPVSRSPVASIRERGKSRWATPRRMLGRCSGAAPPAGARRVRRRLPAARRCAGCGVVFERDGGTWLGAPRSPTRSRWSRWRSSRWATVPGRGLYRRARVLARSAWRSRPWSLVYRPVKGWWLWATWAAGWVHRDGEDPETDRRPVTAPCLEAPGHEPFDPARRGLTIGLLLAVTLTPCRAGAGHDRAADPRRARRSRVVRLALLGLPAGLADGHASGAAARPTASACARVRCRPGAFAAGWRWRERPRRWRW
jgi:hypothetical protein